ncbi:RNA exonuclease 4 isoform X2 [Pseudomyrmex gracilis]|nr:RNA exonuclease 4 isoform X2 [Pseudomyrmex gracilis]
MDNATIGMEKKKKKKNKAPQQLVAITERKASGCNWELYKTLSSTLNTEKSKEEKKQNKEEKNKTTLQNRHPRSKHYFPIHEQVNTKEEVTKKENTKHNDVKSKETQILTKQVAMDCEMVGIGNGTENMLARVSIVNKHGYCVYDKYVKPREKIVDYRTAVSGIRPELVENGEDFMVVQKEVADILKGRVLVGHALRHDLAVLYLSHPRKYLRDTSRYKAFRQISKGGTPSLKKLAHELLGVEIQIGEHDSIEDARVAMQLYMLYKKRWEMERKGR